MGVGDISLLTVVVAALTSMATVFLSDFFGLRRDRARLRMELDWKLQEQRWDALYDALKSCPSLHLDSANLVTSAYDLATWCQTEVEPWIGSDRVNSLKLKREEVNEWLSKLATQKNIDSTVDLPVPTPLINELRELAVKDVTNALQRMRSRFSKLSKTSNL